MQEPPPSPNKELSRTATSVLPTAIRAGLFLRWSKSFQGVPILFKAFLGVPTLKTKRLFLRKTIGEDRDGLFLRWSWKHLLDHLKMFKGFFCCLEHLLNTTKPTLKIDLIRVSLSKDRHGSLCEQQVGADAKEQPHQHYVQTFVGSSSDTAFVGYHHHCYDRRRVR